MHLVEWKHPHKTIALCRNLKNIGLIFGKTVVLRSYCYHSNAKRASDSSGCDEVENPCPCHSAQALRHHVEYGFGQAQLPGDHHGRGDCRVDVAAANVAEALYHGGDAQAEAQRDEDQVRGRRLLLPCSPVDGGAQAEEHEDECGHKFPRHGPPEAFGPDPFKSRHCAPTLAPRQAPPNRENNERDE